MTSSTICNIKLLLALCFLGTFFAPPSVRALPVCLNRGNVDGVEGVTPQDARRAFLHLLGVQPLPECASTSPAVTANDVLCILQVYLGQSACLGAGEGVRDIQLIDVSQDTSSPIVSSSSELRGAVRRIDILAEMILPSQLRRQQLALTQQNNGAPDVPITFRSTMGGIFVDENGHDIGSTLNVVTDVRGIASAFIRLGRSVERERVTVSSPRAIADLTVEILGFIGLEAIAIANNGDLIVVDSALRALMRVNPQTGERRLISGLGQGNSENQPDGIGANFVRPVDVVVIPAPSQEAPDRELFVVVDNLANAVISVETSSGNRRLVAPVNAPLAVAVDTDGTLLVLTSAIENSIVKINPSTGEIIQTISLITPLNDIVVDADARLIGLDAANRSVRVVDRDTGQLNTVAELPVPTNSTPLSLTLDRPGTLVVATTNEILRINTPGDILSILHRNVFFPSGIAIESSGAVVMADSFFQAVTRLDTAGNFRIVSQPPSIGGGLPFFSDIPAIAAGREGSLFLIDGVLIIRVDRVTGGRTPIAFIREGQPRALVVADDGTLIVAIQTRRNDFGTLFTVNPASNTIVEAEPFSGCFGDVEGAACRSEEVGAGTLFGNPIALAADSSNGDVIILDNRRHIWRVDPQGNRRQIGDAATTGPVLLDPVAFAVEDNRGNLLVTDQARRAVLRVDADGNRTVLSGCTGTRIPTTGECTDKIEGTTGPPFLAPAGITVVTKAGRRRIFVVDNGLEALVEVLDNGDRVIRSGCIEFVEEVCAGKFIGRGEVFIRPFGIAAEPSGTIVATDRQLRSVFRIAPENGERSLISRGLFGLGPLLVLPPPQISRQGDAISPFPMLAFHLEDTSTTSDDDIALTFQARNLPQGLIINPATGVVSGTITGPPDESTPRQGQPTVFTGMVHLTVSDGTFDTSVSFPWTVVHVGNGSNAPPVLEPLRAQRNIVGDVINLALVAVDLDRQGLMYSAQNLPQGLSIDSSTGRIIGIVSAPAPASSSAADNPAAFTGEVTITVTDGIDTAETVLPWTVLLLDDPGSTPDTAASIALDNSLAAAIDNPGDVDVFGFELLAQSLVQVFTTGLTDTLGTLLDADGEELSSDDDSGEALNFFLEARLEAGSYFIKVRGFSPGSTTGPYSLQVIRQPFDDHGNTPRTATSLSLHEPVAAELEEAGDVDVFRFDLPATSAVSIVTAGNIDTFGTLLIEDDGEFFEIASNDDSETLNFALRLFLEAGTYFVEVRGYTDAQTGPYTLLVTQETIDDYGNTLATATAISLNAPTEGVIEGTGDVDVFRFELLGTGAVILTTTGGIDTVGRLLDAAGNIVAENDDGPDLNFFIATTPLTAGVYFVEVQGYANITGAYTLQVSSLGDDHGNTLRAATPANLNVAISGVVDESGDMDVFRFDLPAERTVVIFTEGTIDTFGTLFDANGATLAENDDIASPDDLNFLIEEVLPAGTYFVAVRGFSNTISGPYSLHIRVDDHSNAPEQATPLALDLLVAGELGELGGINDSDVFRIELPGNGRVVITTLGDTDTVGSLLDASGNLLNDPTADDDAAGVNLNFLIDETLPAGTYFVVVQGFGGATGSYTLQATQSNDDHGNSPLTAETVEVNTTVTGTLEATNDTDVFFFTLSTGRTVTIATSGPTDTSGTLLTATGEFVVTDDDSGEELNFFLEEFLEAGDYFLEIRGYAGQATGPYSLRISSDDHRNTLSQASDLLFDTFVEGELEQGGDVDVFRFVLSEEGRVIVATTGQTDTFGVLLNAAGDLITTDDDSGTGFNFLLVVQALPAGTYFVEVSGFANAQTGPYTLQVTRVRDDHGDAIVAATPVPFNVEVVGELDGTDDRDFFAFELSAEGTVSITTAGPTDTFGTLFNSTGVVLNEPAADDDAGVDRNFRIEQTLLPGTYFVAAQLFPASDTIPGPYTLQVTGDDYGNVPEQATLLALNVAAVGSLEARGDMDVFRFNLATDAPVTITTTGQTDTFGSLLDATGSLLVADDDSGAGFNFALEVFLFAGTYFVEVRGFNSTTVGSYTLTIVGE